MALKIVKGKSSSRNLTSNHSTPQLHEAAGRGNVSMATSLLNAGCNVDEQDKYGKTALMLAVEGTHEVAIATLLKYNPNIYAKDKFDKSVLQRVFALTFMRKEIIEMFLNILKKDCDDDSQRLTTKLISVQCPFYWAILLRDTEVTRLMLEQGCDISATDSYRPKTALHVAVETRDFANAKLLIECGADVNAFDSSGRIPLSYLISFDDSDEESEVFKMLIDRSVTVNGNDGFGYTQLRSILACGKSRVLKMLFGLKIDWCKEDNLQQSPLHYLAQNSSLRDNADIIDFFRDKEIVVNSADNYKSNILTLAATRGLTKLVKILLVKGIDPNIKCAKGTTLLCNICDMRKCQKSAGAIVGLLLQYGADPQVVTNTGRQTVFDGILRHQNIRIMSNEHISLDDLPLAKYIIGYLALMKFSKTIELTKRIQQQISDWKFFRDEFESCKLQLEELQQTTVSDSTNLFELLNTSDKVLAVYARDQDFFDDFANFDLSTLNPYYSDILRRKFKIVKFRKDTSDLMCEIMNIHYDSYPSVIDKIIDFVVAYNF